VNRLQHILLIFLFLVLFKTGYSQHRIIISSDFPPLPVTNSDPDDVQSMVRFLLYSNKFDVEGLIASAGTFEMVAEKKNMLAVLDEYDKVDENLRKHDPNFPTAGADNMCASALQIITLTDLVKFPFPGGRTTFRLS
jgi:hypothetical protein